MDQPTIDGINTWFVSKAARELGLKAAISGLGGDEIFGGYPSFRDIPRWVRFWAVPSRIPLLGDVFRYFAASLRARIILNPKVAGMPKYGGSFAGAYLLRRGLFMPWELSSLMDKNLVDEGLRRLHPVRHIAAALEPMPRTNFGRVASLEASLYMRNQLLRDADWASMAHSLEVRVPLVDVQLLRAAAPAMIALPNGTGKRCLATSPSLALPPEIIDRPRRASAHRSKTGCSGMIASSGGGTCLSLQSQDVHGRDAGPISWPQRRPRTNLQFPSGNDHHFPDRQPRRYRRCTSVLSSGGTEISEFAAHSRYRHAGVDEGGFSGKCTRSGRPH